MTNEEEENPYEGLSLADLTSIIRRGELNDSFMTKQMYEQLLDYHKDLLVASHSDSMEIMDFCSDKLAIINDLKIDHKKLDSMLGKILVVFLIIMATLAISSAVCYALGIDWFGALFTRAGNQIVYETDGVIDKESTVHNQSGELPNLPAWIPDGFELEDTIVDRTPNTEKTLYIYTHGEDSFHVMVIDTNLKYQMNYFVEGQETARYTYKDNIHMMAYDDENKQAVWKYGSKIFHIIGNGFTKAELEKMIRSYYGEFK